MKRVLAMLLCVMMLVSLIPAAAFAEEAPAEVTEETGAVIGQDEDGSIMPEPDGEDEALPGNESDGKDEVVSEEEPSVRIIAPKTELEPGETMQLTVENLPEGETVTWSSSDEEVLTVDDCGLVTAVGEGEAEIRAEVGKSTYSVELCVCCDCCSCDSEDECDEEIFEKNIESFSVLSAGTSSNVSMMGNTDILETIPTYVELQSTSSSNGVKVVPYGGKDYSTVRSMVSGEYCIATKIVKNKYGNYWYYIEADNGYVNADNVKYIGPAADPMITFDGTDISGIITLTNKQYHLPGTVRQPRNIPITLKAEIIPTGSGTATTTSSDTFSSSSLKLCSKSNTGTARSLCVSI